jgi:hypothetical protein
MNHKILFYLGIIFLLAGCTSNPTEQNTPEVLSIEGPQAGLASVTGKLISITDNNQPMTTTLVRLARIFGEGEEAIYALNDSESPGTYTDKNGFFEFKDIEPGAYALLFTDENGSYRTILENSDKIITVDATVDEITDMGEILVDETNPGP